MTLRLITYLSEQPTETLRNLYGATRLLTKEPNETSEEYDRDVLALANQDNMLQLKRKTVNRAIGMTYVALNMLKAKPECQKCSTAEGVDIWLGMVARLLNMTRARARHIIYNSGCELLDGEYDRANPIAR